MAAPVVLSTYLNNMTNKHMGIKARSRMCTLVIRVHSAPEGALHRSGKHLT